MLIKSDNSLYSFDNWGLSTGKLEIVVDKEVFPKTEFHFFIELVLIDWADAIIHLVEHKEFGLYIFSFGDELHDWTIEYDGSDLLVLNLRIEQVSIKSNTIYMNVLIQGIVDALQNHLDFCEQNNYENDEITDIRKRLKSLNRNDL